MKYIFFGTSEFSANILKGLITIGYQPNLVVTQPDKPARRGKKLTPPPVKTLILNLSNKLKDKIIVLQPEALDQEFLNNLRQFCKARLPKEVGFPSPALFGILAAYGKIIPQNILDFFEPLGIINIHPSLLPKYRGPSPIQSAIIDGEKEAGISLIKLTQQMDAGPLIAQKKILISADDTTLSLEKKLLPQALALLRKYLPLYLALKVPLIEQNHQQATYTKLIKKEDAKINWNEPAQLIERKIRAYQPWPIAWTYYKDIRIQILKASIHQSPASIYQSGTSIILNGKLCFKSADHFLCIERLKPAGKKEMSTEEFLRGLGNKKLKNNTHYV